MLPATKRAAFGPGTYATSMDPTSGKTSILENNYISVDGNVGLADCVVMLDVQTLLDSGISVSKSDAAERQGRDVWILSYEGDASRPVPLSKFGGSSVQRFEDYVHNWEASVSAGLHSATVEYLDCLRRDSEACVDDAAYALMTVSATHKMSAYVQKHVAPAIPQMFLYTQELVTSAVTPIWHVAANAITHSKLTLRTQAVSVQHKIMFGLNLLSETAELVGHFLTSKVAACAETARLGFKLMFEHIALPVYNRVLSPLLNAITLVSQKVSHALRWVLDVLKQALQRVLQSEFLQKAMAFVRSAASMTVGKLTDAMSWAWSLLSPVFAAVKASFGSLSRFVGTSTAELGHAGRLMSHTASALGANIGSAMTFLAKKVHSISTPTRIMILSAVWDLYRRLSRCIECGREALIWIGGQSCQLAVGYAGLYASASVPWAFGAIAGGAASYGCSYLIEESGLFADHNDTSEF